MTRATLCVALVTLPLAALPPPPSEHLSVIYARGWHQATSARNAARIRARGPSPVRPAWDAPLSAQGRHWNRLMQVSR